MAVPDVVKNWLKIWLLLQLAIGPVFFYIFNVTLQRSLYDGLIAVLAITLVDYFYIMLAIVGVGKLLEKKNIKSIFNITSSIVLMIFGGLIIKWAMNVDFLDVASISQTSDLFSSFLGGILLTFSNPLSIVFFSWIFMTKAIEHNYSKKELYIFGLSVWLTTIIFLSLLVVFLSSIKWSIPIILIQGLNLFVGIVLIWYWVVRWKKAVFAKK